MAATEVEISKFFKVEISKVFKVEISKIFKVEILKFSRVEFLVFVYRRLDLNTEKVVISVTLNSGQTGVVDKLRMRLRTPAISIFVTHCIIMYVAVSLFVVVG